MGYPSASRQPPFTVPKDPVCAASGDTKTAKQIASSITKARFLFIEVSPGLREMKSKQPPNFIPSEPLQHTAAAQQTRRPEMPAAATRNSTYFRNRGLH